MKHITSLAAVIALSSVAPGQTTSLYSGHPVDGGVFGGSICQAPDVTGDGRPDLMVGAQGVADVIVFNQKDNMLECGIDKRQADGGSAGK